MIRFLEAYFHMALVASIVTILILLIRPIFKKFSNRIACLLWAVVFFRLLCPFTIERPAILNGDRYEPALAKSVDTSVDSMQNTEIADRFGGTALHSNEEMELPAYRLNASGKESASNRQSVAVTDQRITGNVTAGSANIENANIESANIESANIESANIESANLGNTSRAEDVHKRKTVSGVVLAIQKRLSRCKDAGYVFLGSMLGKAILGVVGSIWLFGAIAFFVIGCIKYRRTAKKLQSAVFMGIRNKYPVKISDIQGTPLSFGILHPAIYVPACFSDRSGKRRMCPVERTNGEIREELCLSDEWQEMILWHEEMHLRHHDPLWKVISFIALCAHWWNPLVWLAIRCMNQDLEMACDEAVLEKIGQDKKTDYATTLLEFATSRGGISLAAAFGESHAERRIVNVIKYRKAPVWLSVVLSVSVLLLGGCLATTDAHKREQEEISEQTAVTEESAGEEIADDSTAEDKLVANEGAAIAIDETHFPDPAFRGYVNQTYDTDQDGVLSEDEILAVTEMKCGNMGIGSLKGVEIFSNLERLDCRKNDLTDLDISQNTKLRCLACSETGINTLDITNCPRLICVRAVGSCYGATTFEAYGGYLDEEKDLSISLCESLLQVNEDAKIVPECEPEKGWDISCMFTDIREERWKEIYLELIENCLCDNDMTETVPYAVEKYAFLYLNDDSVPELVAIGACEDDGTQIFSIANGKVISMRTARREFFYKERGNILDNCAGDMGYYYDYIWKIGENGFERVHNCENEVHGWEDVMNPTKQEFWIDDQPVSEKEYYELIDGLIPAKERVDLNDYEYYGKCSNLKEYLKGEVLKDYKKAYTEIILQNGFEGLGYALIERDGATPLLLSVNEKCYQFASFDDGLISDYTAPFEGERITYGYEDDIVYVYPKLGLLERYYLGERGNGELSSVWIGRYEMRMGTLLDSYLHTNDAEVLASVALPAKVNNADDPFVYSINSVNVSKDEYMDCISNTKGKEKLRVAPYGSEDAEITYLSKEEMLKKLAE